MDKLDHLAPLGICLSGGGAIGLAHIGVLQALLENGLNFEVVSGTSMGAIIGTLFAAGFTPEEMLKLIEQDRLYKVTKLLRFKPGFWKSGFSTHMVVTDLLHELIPHNSFEGLPKKMHICVTNMSSMAWEIKDSGGNLAEWVTASSSIPGVFEAVEMDGQYYLDGGILNNFPTQPLAKSCRAVVGVDVLPYLPPKQMKRPINAIVSALRGIQHVNSRPGKALCSHVIESYSLEHHHEFNFESYLKIYRHGYKDAKEYIKNNPEILSL
jgi:NTE family protein